MSFVINRIQLIFSIYLRFMWAHKGHQGCINAKDCSILWGLLYFSALIDWSPCFYHSCFSYLHIFYFKSVDSCLFDDLLELGFTKKLLNLSIHMIWFWYFLEAIKAVLGSYRKGIQSTLLFILLMTSRLKNFKITIDYAIYDFRLWVLSQQSRAQPLCSPFLLILSAWTWA